MKTGKKIIALLSMLLCMKGHAQTGDACATSILTVVSQHLNGENYSFAGNDHLWFKFSPDTSDAEFQFVPDSISASTNIEKIDLYSGNDCSGLNLVWSRMYSSPDSTSTNTAIHFQLPVSGMTYFLDVKRQAGGGTGFNLRMGYPQLVANCNLTCPNLIRNGDFSTYASYCVSYSNNNPCPDPFNGGCICAWGATHGTPNFDPPNYYPVMGVVNVGTPVGEGIVQNLQSAVISGRNYLLTFDYQNAGGVTGYNYNLYAQLTNGNFNPGICFESIPQSGWNIPGTPVPATSTYTTVHKCFTPNADYGGIRFYPTTLTHNEEWVMIDNVSLEMLDAPLNDPSIYCGQPVTLGPDCPSTNPAVHYLWSTGATTAAITVSPGVTTIYTLTVSVVENGNTLCSFNLPVTVFTHPPLSSTMVAGSATVCDMNSTQTYCFNSTGATWYSFTINPPNAFIPFGGCAAVTWSNLPSSCATIEVTAYAAACTSTTSFQFCAPCQGSPSNLTFCDESASDILNNPIYASYISGGNIFTVPPGSWASFHGTFTVDVPFVINNSDIRFGPDAKIKVNNFQVFEIINQSHLHSCDGINMWNGIYTEDISAYAYIHDGNNLIEDAKNAIVSNNGGHFEVNSTTFNNNYIGIKVNAYSGNHPGRIWGCTFTGSGTLLSPYQNYCSMNYPACGIVVDQVSHIQIGEPVFYFTYGRNYFQSLLCGISSSNSGLNVYTSEFNNILNPGSLCNASQGCGIYARGSNLAGYNINVGNVTAGEQCFFDHCRIGILERLNCYGDIKSNTFRHCDFGIINNSCSKYHNLVKGNIFEDFKRGIYFFNATNQLQQGLEIYENMFNIGMTSYNPASYGLQAINVSNPVSARTNLWAVGNVINYCKVGIFVRNVWEPCNINSNTINFDILPHDVLLTGTHHGIECENDNGLEIENNMIRWRNQPTAPTGFISMMNGISINYSSNTTAISGGIYENKIGPYPAVNSGTTYGMGSGINISSNCMGLTLYCNKMCRCEEGVTFRNAQLGPQGTQDHSLNWYSNGNTFSYTPGQGGNYRIAGTLFQAIEWPYINGTENPSPFQFGLINPLQTNFTYAHCMPPAPADDIKREDDFGILINTDTEQLIPEYSGYEEQLRYVAKEKFYNSVKMDSSILDVGTSDDSAYENLFMDLDHSNIAKMQEVKTAVDSMDYGQAIQKLALLADSNLMEHNKKIVMQVFLETFAADSLLDSARVALIEPISNLHPVIGGEAVFWACAMLDKEVNNILPPLRKAKPGDNKVVYHANIHVYPNPASNVLYVKYHSENPLRLVITDMPGKIVLEQELESKTNFTILNTAGLQAGTYTLKVMDTNTTLFTDKLLIIR